jgi:hypothetical protein
MQWIGLREFFTGKPHMNHGKIDGFRLRFSGHPDPRSQSWLGIKLSIGTNPGWAMENHGKTMGKPWENHGKMVISMENQQHFSWVPGLVNVDSLRTGKSPCSMGKSTISMVIFNSYIKLPQGKPTISMAILNSKVLV